MASTSKCKYCGQTVSSSDEHCPNCGAPNEGYVADTERRIILPRTIEELKEYCAERGMPLLRMRFFIGEDYRQPKAYGIYRDGDNFIVYKNKADGERAIRYQGPDEKFAVGELFEKLLEECNARKIYPDGRPDEFGSRETVRSSRPDKSIKQTGTRRRKKHPFLKLLVVLLQPVLILLLLYLLISVFRTQALTREHINDGYYRTEEGAVYYRYGVHWYTEADNGNHGKWYETNEWPVTDYEKYLLGEDWDSSWGVSDIQESAPWNQPQRRNPSVSPGYQSFSGRQDDPDPGSDRDSYFGDWFRDDPDRDPDWDSVFDDWNSEDTNQDSDWGSYYDDWDSDDSDWDSDWGSGFDDWDSDDSDWDSYW